MAQFMPGFFCYGLPKEDEPKSPAGLSEKSAGLRKTSSKWIYSRPETVAQFVNTTLPSAAVY